MSSTYNSDGSWTDEFRGFVAGIRASDDRTDVLDALLRFEEVRDSLLANPTLTDEQLRTLIGQIDDGGPAGTSAELAVLLADAALPRLGISPKCLARTHIPDLDVARIRSGATDARRAGEVDPTWNELAEGVATALDGLAAGGSLPWLRRYGGGNGYARETAVAGSDTR
jgi:hypothetical protein